MPCRTSVSNFLTSTAYHGATVMVTVILIVNNTVYVNYMAYMALLL